MRRTLRLLCQCCLRRRRDKSTEPSGNSDCSQRRNLTINEVNQMSRITSSEAAKAVVRRNTEEVQGRGNFDVFEELFADDFIDHTPQPNTTPNNAGVRKLYTYIRAAFPDFHAEDPLATCRWRPSDDLQNIPRHA